MFSDFYHCAVVLKETPQSLEIYTEIFRHTLKYLRTKGQEVSDSQMLQKEYMFYYIYRKKQVQSSLSVHPPRPPSYYSASRISILLTSSQCYLFGDFM